MVNIDCQEREKLKKEMLVKQVKVGLFQGPQRTGDFPMCGSRWVFAAITGEA